ncbi:uncharacterized protein LOC103873166 isoform X1 [Brassica rapa]|uniref:Bacterial Ig-like domain-containing protein n=2 Tax=Brassica campestris TaxID=3711 RepID=A0A3P5YH12_BRACM|nr:uncharacterized protein LOC103873166 isoform X1 [Brassica rapa]CAG7869805.1 unnamed protein product [Brassica rapa]VDC66489.1 unnamed protein product [Brassica rapa]
MGLLKSAWILFLFLVVFSSFCFRFHYCYGSELSVKFLKTPPTVSRFHSAKFSFQAFENGNTTCSSCKFQCKLDDQFSVDCHRRRVSYSKLLDGNHTLEVCANRMPRFGCNVYNWTVDTVSPTASVTASMPFTSAQNVSVNITFTEPCVGGGGFRCSSVNACDLLVYGAGQVIPSSFTVLENYLRYSLLVGLSLDAQYGRLVLVMDKSVCSDTAGNSFKRALGSRFFVHFDRRNVFVNLRTHVPEKLLKLNNQTRTVQATNDNDKLNVYLYFSEPVLNSSAEILKLLSTNHGDLLPIDGKTNGNRRFAFMVTNTSRRAIVTVTLDSNSIRSRHGTPASPTAPLTFLYDTERPHVVLNTTSGMRTRKHTIPVWIKFMKPVFGFNSSLVSISGGYLDSFEELSGSIYIVYVKANTSTISVKIPENVTQDVAGNKNLESNILEVTHYSVSVMSSVISWISTYIFLVTCCVAGLLTLSTTSLYSLGAFPRPSPYLISDPTRNLFRTACHIQFFALTRWLPVTLPVDYYEFVRRIQWIIPYFPLPWETKHSEQIMVASSPFIGPHSFIAKTYHNNMNLETATKAEPVFGLPLTAMEYRLFFETPNLKPEAEHVLGLPHPTVWRDFYRIMFWIAIIGGSLVLLHILLSLILKFKKAHTEKKRSFGAFVFPRFELFLLILALPSICKAARSLIQGYFKHQGDAEANVIVGILVLCIVAILLLALFLFLSVGITFGKLLQYKEIHQEGQNFHWYQELIRVTLGPGKRGQWTWKKEDKSIYLTRLGPVFEDLRGPPKYMLTQISGSNPLKQRDDRIIASDDETEDAEAPCIQKLFGILRIYYTFLETVKRVCLGIIAGAFLDNETSKTPVVVLLCITSFQLFFLVLKKPFIKKKVQLVEIISIACQVGVFASCLVLLAEDFPEASGQKLGIFMVVLFLIGFITQMCNEWYSLYKQTKRLDQINRSFLSGLKMFIIGLAALILPQKLMKSKIPAAQLEGRSSSSNGGIAFSTPENRYINSSGSRSSGSLDKPWLRQIREMAKASFTRDRSSSKVPSDPSGSKSGWSSSIWGTKTSGSSSKDSSSDYKSRPKGLYKDLEAIFASK